MRVAGEAAVAGVGLHGGQDRGELFVHSHERPPASKWAKGPRQWRGTSAVRVIGSVVVGV